MAMPSGQVSDGRKLHASCLGRQVSGSVLWDLIQIKGSNRQKFLWIISGGVLSTRCLGPWHAVCNRVP